VVLVATLMFTPMPPSGLVYKLHDL
jgi:hypothetical protein